MRANNLGEKNTLSGSLNWVIQTVRSKTLTKLMARFTEEIIKPVLPKEWL